MPTANAPSARYYHTPVFTGSRMAAPITSFAGASAAKPRRRSFFGGLDTPGSPVPTNTGGAYDPQGDRWFPMDAAAAPAARYYHAAVWTGRELLIWGGTGNGVPTNTCQPRLRPAPWRGIGVSCGDSDRGALYDP